MEMPFSCSNGNERIVVGEQLDGSELNSQEHLESTSNSSVPSDSTANSAEQSELTSISTGQSEATSNSPVQSESSLNSTDQSEAASNSPDQSSLNSAEQAGSSPNSAEQAGSSPNSAVQSELTSNSTAESEATPNSPVQSESSSSSSFLSSLSSTERADSSPNSSVHSEFLPGRNPLFSLDESSDSDEPSPPSDPSNLRGQIYIGLGGFNETVYAGYRGSLVAQSRNENRAIHPIVTIESMRTYLNVSYVPFAAPMTLQQLKELPKVSLTAEDLENNDSCVICCEKFVLDAMVTKLSCSHFFHSECIEKWLKRSGNCPICRTMFTHAIPGLE